MDLLELAQSNRRQILRYLLQTGGTSRTQIVQHTGLSFSRVTDITNTLLQKRIIRETKTKSMGKRGRPITVLSLNRGSSLVLVVSNLEKTQSVHLVDAEGNILAEKYLAIASHLTFDNYVTAQQQLVMQVAVGRWKKIQGIMVAGPGVVDARRGLLILSTYRGLRNWKNRNIVEQRACTGPPCVGR